MHQVRSPSRHPPGLSRVVEVGGQGRGRMRRPPHSGWHTGVWVQPVPDSGRGPPRCLLLWDQGSELQGQHLWCPHPPTKGPGNTRAVEQGVSIPAAVREDTPVRKPGCLRERVSERTWCNLSAVRGLGGDVEAGLCSGLDAVRVVQGCHWPLTARMGEVGHC